ncbi:hypothetical protein AGMMS49587_04790 [Spirochaetia bacterium]|nr:hypothetical protein AGMMS49587_04790 [Spirochaetia bacterium]
MSVSNEYIIHYTKKMDTLESIILDRAFKVCYCHETISAENESQVGFLDSKVPMVCFTDIPFSETKKHPSSYGSYGIGFTKKWALVHKLNPVTYMAKESSLIWSVKELEKILVKPFLDKPKISKNDPNQYRELLKHYNHLLGYIKNYEGYNSYTKENDFSFYNEREWRYTPSEGDAMKLFTREKDYRERPDLYNNLAEKYSLIFCIGDIARIILKQESEKSSFLDNLKQKGIQDTDLELIRKKIITVENSFT